jgi:hypothetical protein
MIRVAMPRQTGRSVSGLAAALVAIVLLQSFAISHAAAACQAVPASQTPAQSQQSTPIEIPPAPGAGAPQSGCPLLADRYVPINRTIETRVTTLLDSARLKPGRKIWVNSLFEVDDPECRLAKNAVIYGGVTVASSSNKSAATELGLRFDHADCLGQAAKAMNLTLIAIVAPESSHSDNVHSALPGLGGGVSGGYGWDQKLDPGGPPNFVHPGEVVGFKKLSLDPYGGPRCSARLTSADPRIELGLGTVLIFAVADSE